MMRFVIRTFVINKMNTLLFENKRISSQVARNPSFL